MVAFSSRTISPSCIDLINRKILELQSQGQSIVKFNIGNLDTERPIDINEIDREEFNNSNHYTNIRGNQELRELVAERIKKTSGLVYDINKEMTIVSGTRSGIFYTFNSILNKGDEVIIPRGTWVTYFNMLENFDAKPVLADTKPDNNYKLTPEILENCITERTKAVVITNPGNPTGAIFSKDELSALLAVVKKHKDMIIMSDEIYTDIHFTDDRVVSLAEAADGDKELLQQIVVFNGFSKNISMAGDRIAYVLCYNQELLTRIYGGQALINSNTNNIAQIIAKTIMKKDLKDYFATLINRLKTNRDYACAEIDKIKGLSAQKPDGALYIMVNYSELKRLQPNNPAFSSDLNITNYLLENGVAVTPGQPFGLNDSFRICFACSLQELKDGIELIRKAIEG